MPENLVAGLPLPITMSAVFFAAAFIPFVLLAATSFLKLSVVFTILRNAIGAQQIPSGAVSSLLALVLTIYVMQPIGAEVYKNFSKTPLTIASTIEALTPLKNFLEKHAHPRERAYFAAKSGVHPTFALLPAFMLSQLKEAFQLGFILYLPFLVVDLVVTNVLIGLSMSMVSPVMISLPLKLLLFYAADGWFLVCRSLIEGYGG